ncbi:uncharacterized protein LOC128546329 [Mercenaria mercenaria]|uniref:uncharacterized protein LOC128546329 n=1 Tax=Mercenaria mercenaria TaxID=6596 RepID=UPI00234F9543|nr:uncharacterized protein LOC128546329 [Mercenaria mercenaria]
MKNKDSINEEIPSPTTNVPDIYDLEYVKGLGNGNSNSNAEKVKPRRKRRRSEKQKERFRQYLIKRAMKQYGRLHDEMHMYVYQVCDAVPDPMFISESEAIPVMPQVLSSASLPSPAFGNFSPNKDISLRDFKDIFGKKLSGCPNHAVLVSTLNVSAKPFVPASLRKAEKMPEVQPVLDSSVVCTVLAGNQDQETVFSTRSSAEPDSQETESKSSASVDTFVTSCEKSLDVPVKRDGVCDSTKFDVLRAKISPYNTGDDGDVFVTLDCDADSCLLSDILCLFISLFIILTLLNAFL